MRCGCRLPKTRLKKPVFKGAEWSFPTLQKGWDVIQEIAKGYNWKGYPTQFEVLSSEQMLDVYSSHGMPTFYTHWSFGKHFLRQQEQYMTGRSGLAYELVINTNPSICYVMEDNSQMMQLLVTAHAAVGHNHFFKNNYLFRQWTKPDFIVDYLVYAREFIKNCEEKHGSEQVEMLLDAAHSVQYHSVFKYVRKHKSKNHVHEQTKARLRDIHERYNPVFDGDFGEYKSSRLEHYETDVIDDENLLHYIIKYSRVLKPWQREILTIVMNVSQYFYPQIQTKMLNEGFASFVHYTIMNELYDYGYIDSDYMLEFIESHTAVLNQPAFLQNKILHGINPYYLGFNLFKEIKRICENPTEEDKAFSPSFAGSDWKKTINFVVENYRDESAIREFVTPNMIRKLQLVQFSDRDTSSSYAITATHADEDHETIRNQLADQYTWHAMFPDVRVVRLTEQRLNESDLLRKATEKVLYIEVDTEFNNPINAKHVRGVKQYLTWLWGDDVILTNKTHSEG